MSEQKRKIYCFDDGSLQAKVMFKEHSKDQGRELQSILIKLPKPLDELESLNLEDYFNEIPSELLKDQNTTIKVDLHFTTEDYDKFNIDKQLAAIQEKYKNLSLIKTYQFMSKRGIEHRAKSLGLIKVKEKEKPGEVVNEEVAKGETVEPGAEVEKTEDSKAKKKPQK